jgi:hypothetical protein
VALQQGDHHSPNQADEGYDDAFGNHSLSSGIAKARQINEQTATNEIIIATIS